jgi:hypothetical protein
MVPKGGAGLAPQGDFKKGLLQGDFPKGGSLKRCPRSRIPQRLSAKGLPQSGFSKTEQSNVVIRACTFKGVQEEGSLMGSPKGIPTSGFRQGGSHNRVPKMGAP